jgi:hypothetical protein
VLGTRMRAEHGIQESVRSFYKQLGDLSVFRCDVNPHTKAALYMPTKGVKLSIETVNMLIQRGTIKQKHLRALRPWRCAFVGWDPEQPLSCSPWRTTSAPCCVVQCPIPFCHKCWIKDFWGRFCRCFWCSSAPAGIYLIGTTALQVQELPH